MDYSDIIGLPHHESKRHKPMSRLKRAAQFAPFAAVRGYDDAIAESTRATEEAMEISADIADQLELQLSVLRQRLYVNPSTAEED